MTAELGLLVNPGELITHSDTWPRIAVLAGATGGL